MKARLKAQSACARVENSRLIADRLFALEAFQKASRILCYAAFDGEVETKDILGEIHKLKKIIGLPKVIKEQHAIVPIKVDNLHSDLESGQYGILEPRYQSDKILSLENLDLVIVPALAFDQAGFRLGRGQGFYDRFLAKLPATTITVGLAFDFQIIESLPEKASFDLPVRHVITN